MQALVFFKSWGSKTSYLRIVSLATEMKQSLVYAIDEAHQRKDSFIGTEHLLLGLARLNEASLVMQVLKQWNISPQLIRQKTIAILDAS